MNFEIDNISFNGVIDLNDKINIKSSNKIYEVEYCNKNLDTIFKELYVFGDFIFIDRNVYNLSPSTFIDLQNNILIFEAIENNKDIESVLELTDKLYNLNFTKKNKLIVIGGGITQDVGGFASAIYKRGINWVFIPTTLLSMTDSCIGSKVSINRISKNILGVFIAPNNIVISDYFLNSLTDDDVISGIGEALKLSLIGGKNTHDFFMKKFASKDYINIIKIASLVKKQIIEFDEFELHTRKVLNYGHTIGHAIECTTNYFIPHGIAVLIGMLVKNILFNSNKFDTINKFILDIVNPKFFNIEFNFSEFKKHILSDKKNKGNEICFIVLEDIGKTTIIYKNIQDIEIQLKEIMISIFKSVK